MHSIVVAGGDLVPSARVLAVARAAGLVIAVDSGARHLGTLSRTADVLLGDFDSFAPADQSCEVIRYPIAKDATDTHLGVREARRRGADRISLVAALRGPRLDHAAANLLLLSADEFSDLDVRAVDGDDELRAVRKHAVFEGRPGDLITLLAVTRTARGVTVDGLAYPLRRGVLARGDSRGVSNVMLGERAQVSVETGVLLAIHRDGTDPNVLISGR